MNEEFDRYMREAGFDTQLSGTRVFRPWTCRFSASFRVDGYWLVRAWTWRGVLRKARRRRTKDLNLIDRVNHKSVPRHNMKESR